MDISNNLKTVLDNINNDIAALDDSIPSKTSQLTNDSGFITDSALTGKLDAPSGGTEGQVLTKTANGEEWADAQGGTIKVDDKVASGAFVVDFAGAQIQKYDVDSAVSGTINIQYDNIDIPEGTAPTVELQVPVTGDVSNIVLPSDTSVIDMPVILEGGQFNYHDIVFRAQRDHNDDVIIYANYAYKFNEGIDYLKFTATQNDSAVAFAKVGTPSNTPTLEYSLDKNTWQTYTIDTVISLNEGDTVYFRGDNAALNTNDYDNYYKFATSGGIKGGGSIASIVNKSAIAASIPTNYYFAYLFKESTALITAPKLPYKSLEVDGAYYEMFNGCSSLSAAPDLPATNAWSRCYYEMFANCTSLTKAKIALTDTPYFGCYQMFTKCELFNELEVHFTYWKSYRDYCTTSWLFDVASNGTFKCPAVLDTTTRDDSHVPENWTVVNI